MPELLSTYHRTIIAGPQNAIGPSKGVTKFRPNKVSRESMGTCLVSKESMHAPPGCAQIPPKLGFEGIHAHPQGCVQIPPKVGFEGIHAHPPRVCPNSAQSRLRRNPSTPPQGVSKFLSKLVSKESMCTWVVSRKSMHTLPPMFNIGEHRTSNV